MALYRGTYRIESARLQEWDYGASGWYFVTICTRERQCFFGTQEKGLLSRTDVGDVAYSCWEAIPTHFPQIVLDAFVVMPNHVHGLVGIPYLETVLDCSGKPREIAPMPGRDAACCVSTGTCADHSGNEVTVNDQPSIPKRLAAGSLPVIIRSYKAAVTRTARLNGRAEFAWQSRYHEHVIRSGRSLEAIRAYIHRNPERWSQDRYYSRD